MEPRIEEVRESEYTHGELNALLAPVLGVSAEDIKALAIIVDLGDKFTLGGTPSTDAAQELIVRALMSGILGFTLIED